VSGLDLHLDDSALDAIAERAAEIAIERLRDQATLIGWMDSNAAAIYAGTSPTQLRKAMMERRVRYEQDGPQHKAWFRREWIDAWRSGEDPP
jgi:hypothetical protein